MNGRTRSFSALESSNGNWIISPQQMAYDSPRNIKQKRIPTGNTLNGKSRGYPSETWAESTTLSKAAHESYMKRDGQRGRHELTYRKLKGKSRRSHSVERTSTSTTNSSGYVSSRENVGRLIPRELVLYKSDGEFGFTMRQISSTTYGGKPVSAFRPTAEVPALQRLNCIDPGSLAERVGLKPGDYIIEVNNESVTCAPHPYVVHLITSSPDVLKLKVVEGSEDVFKPPSQSTLPQSNSTGRHASNGKSRSTSSSAPRLHDVELPISKRSNGIPLQQLTLNGNHPLHRTTLAPLQNSNNGLTTTERRRLPTAKPVEPVVANIRLSRVAAHDQVYYESALRHKMANSTSQSRTASVDLQRIPSFTSTVTIRSDPEDVRRHVSEKSSRGHKSVTSGSVQGEPLIMRGKGLAVISSVSSAEDMSPTYDRVRPVNVPFDTDEGYIRLSSNVDYVAQTIKEQEQVNFLAMAEKARQMYLRTKSISQVQ